MNQFHACGVLLGSLLSVAAYAVDPTAPPFSPPAPPKLPTTAPVLTPPPLMLDAGPSIYPFVLKNLTIRVRSLPGVRVDPDDVTFAGSCRFVKRSGVVHTPVNIAADGSVSFGVQGWFEAGGPNDCQVQVTLRPIAADGRTLPKVELTAPLAVRAPSVYTFNNTKDLIDRFNPVLVHFGVGSICEATANPNLGIKASGVTTVGSDMQILTRGTLLDVECSFRTKEWILPEGVRLKEIDWKPAEVGNRCHQARNSSGGFVSFSLTRGTAVVRPEADQPVTDFFTFSDSQLAVDGVTFGSQLHGPQTMIKQLTLAIECTSMAVVFVTSDGTFGPTSDPQSYGIVLDKIVFEGPPGLEQQLN